jgi:regulation of enolase protein 1 (concanavalin A-like superfamily)
MFRETTAPGSPAAFVIVTPSGNVSFISRTTANGTTTAQTIPGISVPCWLRLTRQADNFTASYSPDGTTWTVIGAPVSIPMASATAVGLAITSGTDGTLCSSMLDNVTDTPAPPGLPTGWSAMDIGSTGVSGNNYYSSNNATLTITGSGSDIWNNVDAFRYAYQPLTGDGAITARVTSIANTNVWAKAGVMIRESLAAGSTHASMVVTPGSGVSFQRRTTTSSASSETTTGGLAAPYWVRIVRSGSVFTGLRSTDGANWTNMGSVTIPMTPNAYIGLAVTSHDNTVATNAAFDSITVSVPPPSPTGLTATGSAGQVALNWSASPGANGYQVKRGTVSGGPYTIIATPATATHNDTTVVDGLTYYYVVSATTIGGESANSSQASALPTTPSVTWRQAMIGVDWNNAAIADDTADPDGDGLNNLIERAFNGDPNSIDSTLTIASLVDEHLVLFFTRSTANTDLTLTVQAADSPGGPWTDLARSTSGTAFTILATGATATESGTGTTRDVQASDIFLISDPLHPVRFMRLQAQP